MYLRNYGLCKKWLDKWLKTPVSDQTSASNIVNEPEHFSILDDSMFTKFIDYCEVNWVVKSIFYYYAKS